tara:strand:- start:212 stop:424 length:213 start_codon:yes stop_codon:yes gene_type:complete
LRTKAKQRRTKRLEDTKMKTYKVIRFYRELRKASKVIRRGLTLEEARAHCLNPSTQKEGVWFDGFESENN